MYDANEVYQAYCDLRDEKFEEGGTAATVAMLRVATETGAQTIGPYLTCYLLSRVLTITLGLTVGDEDATYDGTLEKVVKLADELSDCDPDPWSEALKGSVTKH